ncbi:MAG TPA: VIT domain-containing protein [Verrucomicrobiae bacterium]
MNHWTDSARAKLEGYFAEMRRNLKASGADVEEVVDDLRRHVEQETAVRNLRVVTEQDVGQILARIGGPETAVAVAEPEARVQERGRTDGEGVTKPPGWWLLFFGVVLPLGAIIFEFLTGACAGVLFDPLPTVGHLALTLFVPAANFVVWRNIRRGQLQAATRLGWANGVAIGIALIYGLLFLPFTPFALLGVLVYGLGLVPLSPLLSLVVAIMLRDLLRSAVRPAGPPPGLWRGLGVGAFLVCLFTVPLVLTNIGLQMAVSDSFAESTRGVKLLRAWGEDKELLRACYGRSGRAGEIYSWGRPINPETARAVYYRVHGRAFNSVPPPKLYAGRARWSMLEQEFTWDNDQGGDAVAGRVRGLSLVSSRQDGFVDADAALAYLEWTLEFKNDSPLRREARAQIALPPGGVVSRLTLWINGEECEAAFGGRSQVKTAYKEVVHARRDPVLVTTCGPDLVLVQCFPVPAAGGKMKVRLGITTPLTLTSLETGRLRWPCFVERNFSVPQEFRHSVWVETRQSLEAAAKGMIATQTKPGNYQVRGEITDTDLCDARTSLSVGRDPRIRQCWTRDTRADAEPIVRQIMEEKPVATPKRILLVVDGTEGMEACYPAVAAALKHLPPEADFGLLLARDGCEELVPLQKANPALCKTAADRLLKSKSLGGHDNVPALIRAWDLAAESNGGAIVWIHASQPMLLENAEALRQRFERHSNPPRLIDLQTVVGPNRVVEKLDGIEAVQLMPRNADLATDLQRFFSSWNGRSTKITLVRERASAGTTEASGRETSLHLARLWAREEVLRLGSKRLNSDALELASRYQLVTPVSGAVVLETKAQYERADLKPVPPESVPAVPEPSVAALLLVACALLGRRLGRRRR